jgi:hypothetical protein
MEEAYSHEVSSAGWWPGSDGVGPAFYSYMYPEPAGFRSGSIEPAPAHYDEPLGDFILPYRTVVEADDPEAAVMTFLESTYSLGSTLADWKEIAPAAERVLEPASRARAHAGPGSYANKEGA